MVGGGGSGLACAVRAAELGAEVLVLEKQPALGGTTGRAVGSFTASRSSHQRKAGIADDPADHNVDAGGFGPPEYQARSNDALRGHFLAEFGATLEWLTGMGLAFHGPSPEPPNRVPRMHNVVPNAKAYIAVLQARLVRLGGTIRTSAPVEDLVLAGGAVCGVIARVEGSRRQIRARRGVVLAAGDYASSPELIAEYRGPRFSEVEGINPHAGGDGHRLAERAGAQLVNMDITYGPELRFLPPERATVDQLLPSSGPLLRIMSRALPLVPGFVIRAMVKRLLVAWQHPEDSLLDDGAILLSRRGERFCDETAPTEREIAVAGQPGKVAFLLLDERLADRYSAWPHFISTAPEIAYAYVPDYLRLRPDLTVERPSVEATAEAHGLPPAPVRDAVDRFNAAVVDEFGRRASEPLAGSRWVLLGPLKAFFTTTEGGAAIDSSLRVLDGDGRPIPGLFAVGQNGLGGMVLWGHGLHIGWALTSGRLVGERLGPSGASSMVGRETEAG